MHVMPGYHQGSTYVGPTLSLQFSGCSLQRWGYSFVNPHVVTSPTVSLGCARGCGYSTEYDVGVGVGNLPSLCS